MDDLWGPILGAGMAVIGVLVIWGVGNLKKYVEKTPTKLDDEALAKLEEAVKKAFNSDGSK